MSGSTIISPTAIDSTLLQDGQQPQTIGPTAFRQTVDSLSGLLTTTQGGAWTFALTDRGTMVEGTAATAQTFTVPPNSSVAFQINTIIYFRQYGAGQITIAAGAGVTLRTSSSLTTRALYSTGSIHKRATDEWVVSGDLT